MDLAQELAQIELEEVRVLEREVVLGEKELFEGNLREFVKAGWHILEPGTPLVWNWHLDVICAYLEAYVARDIKRVIFNVPPGSMKSLLVSVFMPAWVWAKDPSRRFINLTNEVSLATRDSRRMKELITSDWYLRYWGEKVELSQDQREKAHFSNTEHGFRQGLGISGNISGKRGTDLLIDDPIDTKKAFSEAEIQGVNNTYDQAVSSRLNNLSEDGICVIMQRSKTNDLTGHMLKKKQKWVHVCIPMEAEGIPGYDPVRDLGITEYHPEPDDRHPLKDPRKPGDLMFEARFPMEVVETLKEDLGEYGTAGQLQQRPSPLGGGIIKREWWQLWPDDKPFPRCEHVFLSWDTAYTERDIKTASYSAMTSWGVFWHDGMSRHCLFLLSAWWDRVDYPTLRKLAQKLSIDRDPDAHLIEKKASGQSLIQDLRRAGHGSKRIRLRTYSPDRDKMARAAAASVAFSGGLVYAPNRRWAEDVISNCGDFPNGAPPSEDITDTVTQAVHYLSRRLWVSHPDDDEPENEVGALPDVDDLEGIIEDRHEGIYG